MALDQEIKIPFEPSTIENIDAAMLHFLKDLNLYTKTNQGFKRVPVVWASPERSFQSKVDSEIRDKQGALIYPIMSVERSSLVKDPNKRGTVWANIIPESDKKGGAIPVARRINQYKTKNFANADAKLKNSQINFPRPNTKIVYEVFSMPLPVYVEVTYKITIRTEYQEQINDLITPFITRPGGINYFIIEHEHHKYEAFVQSDYSQKNNLTDYSSEERRYETEINIKVLGYLIGDGKNQEKPYYAIRENAVEVKIPRERIIFGDVLDHENGQLYGLAGLPSSFEMSSKPYMEAFTQGRGSTGPAGDENSAITEANLPEKLDEVLAIREVPYNTCNSAYGPGNGCLKFKTTHRIFENTETLFVNGLLQTPGVHYRILSSDTFELIGSWVAAPPKTAEEKGSSKSDAVIISYILG